jgi:hypothetical protein
MRYYKDAAPTALGGGGFELLISARKSLIRLLVPIDVFRDTISHHI